MPASSPVHTREPSSRSLPWGCKEPAIPCPKPEQNYLLWTSCHRAFEKSTLNPQHQNLRSFLSEWQPNLAQLQEECTARGLQGQGGTWKPGAPEAITSPTPL